MKEEKEIPTAEEIRKQHGIYIWVIPIKYPDGRVKFYFETINEFGPKEYNPVGCISLHKRADEIGEYDSHDEAVAEAVKHVNDFIYQINNFKIEKS